MTSRLAVFGHILYGIGSVAAAGFLAIMILEAIALFQGRVSNFEKFFDPFTPIRSVDFPTMPQAFALAIAAWLFALFFRWLFVGEKNRELHLSKGEVGKINWLDGWNE
ncbi:MAG TPA: hypothetical protein VM144_14495 [Aestuariivirga sp.]|nr:hypothetical protein [Aestuariivirga sp.]